MVNIFNNFYGMGGQPVGETSGVGIHARIGSGVNADGMHAERVDGFNPLAVAEATARKKEILLRGDGPVLMDTITYRFSGHSPSDAMTYRTKEEVDAFRHQDPIISYAAYLIENKVATESELEEMRNEVLAKVKQALALTVDDKISPMVGW